MRIQDIGGEFALIERLKSRFAANDDSFLGIGDDAAVVDLPSDRQLVVTTDMLVESVHFRLDWSDPYSIGWKAAAVNLSDIAAMGAVPTYAFVSLGLTAKDTVECVDELYAGFCDCLTKYGAKLAGGDTNSAPESLTISVTLLGHVAAGAAIKRSAARVGDRILVTGTLGDSAAGLALLQGFGIEIADSYSALIERHRRPVPRIAAGLAAAATGKVHAAIDISDGVYGDLKKLCQASKVGAQIVLGRLPKSESLLSVEAIGLDPAITALRGGEDYELLFTVAAEDVEDVKDALHAVGESATDIGKIEPEGIHIVGTHGQKLDVEGGGWDHFS